MQISDNSFVVLRRKIINWEWYTDNDVKALFLHCLLRANFEDDTWRGVPVKRGQFITGLFKLHEETGISVQTLRRCIKCLKSTNEIVVQSTNRFSLITVFKYEKYQVKLTSKTTSQPTNNQQTTNKQLTTSNNINNINNGNKGEGKTSPEAEKQLPSNELDTQAREVMAYYAKRRNKVVKSYAGWIDNFKYWITEGGYTVVDIKRAIDALETGRFWAKDADLTLIFRRSNKQGKCDYICELLNIMPEFKTRKEQLDWFDRNTGGLTGNQMVEYGALKGDEPAYR